MHRRAYVAAAIVSAACFGVLAVLTKLAYEGGALPLQLLSWRFSLAALVLGAYSVVRRPGALRVPAGDLARYALLSVAGYGAASICFFFALSSAPASIVEILLYTYPAMIALTDQILVGQRLLRSRAIAVAIAFLGCVLVVDPFATTGKIGLVGVLLGLGSAVGYANFSLLSARVLPGRSRLTMMTYIFAFTSLLATGAALATGTPLSPAAWDTTVWFVLATIVLVPTFAAVVLYLAAIRGLGVSQAALLSTSEPLFTIAFAALMLGDRLSAVQWAGAALVMGGVVAAEIPARGAPPSETVVGIT